MKMFNIFNWVQNLVKFCTLNWDDDDGGAPPVQQSTSYSTNLPEYAQPYYTELLKQTGKQVFNVDSTGNVTGVKPYQAYTGERIAGFTPEQLALQQQIGTLATPTEFNKAETGLSSLQSLGLSNAQTGLNRALAYDPGTIASQNINAPSLTKYQMAGPSLVSGISLRDYLMNAATPVSAERASADRFSPEAAESYMSPYQQGVTDIALREARRQGDILKQQGALGAIGRGTFGGARQSLLQAEQERGIQQNLADIQTRGSQAAYENAQKQFLADQANRMAAQQLNVQSGLQAGLANQQMQQQANVQNLAAQLQTQGLSADQAMKAAIANQQAQQTTQQQNLQALLGVQQLGSGQSIEAQRANQAAALQAAQLTQQGQQYAAGLGKDVGLAGLSTSLEGAKALGALGATEQQANLERLKAQAATAEEKQALQQQINDLKYQQFQEQQNYQRNLLDYYSNILRGNAGALGSTQVQYTAAPTQAQQIASLGLSGLSLYKALS
jgi:hypothetical protein